jgi:hypothetical protein
MQVVTIDKKGRALQRVVKVSEGLREELMWVALGDGGPWKVTFDKGTASPFSENAYTVSPGDVVRTGGGPRTDTKNNTYKYNVRNATTNEITDDPDVDVEP